MYGTKNKRSFAWVKPSNAYDVLEKKENEIKKKNGNNLFILFKPVRQYH
jgi:hypothetical protein